MRKASNYRGEYDGGCLQMRLSYSPAAQFILFLIQWTDCHLAGALGLLRILIYKAYEDGKTTMSIHERKASLKEFYSVIFPSLLQLQRGLTDVEDRKQKEIFSTKYKRKDQMDKGKLSEIDSEREEECGVRGRSRAPSAGTASKESTHVTFGSTPATMRLLTYSSSL
ncbi:RING/U-box superfamily protein [Prunus dulcis]|uniref:RING/U-box superfamily protein n=1 Tax=Prunus dulcis TaxID=3755 RepID=A0A4Y1RQN0_PRUDU|nr:RING/U-box superfamily protein [Prunus dulcis]